jgi:LytS/YehU family sensor histidine kinase
VRAYLGLMAARMPRLQWHIDVPADLLDAGFPPLMLISLAENAVKHGVERKIGPARITVTARIADDGRLAVSVRDDGPGFQAAGSGTGIGLANIRERLAELHPGRAGLALEAPPGGGVEATIRLPLERLAAPAQKAAA